jgi:glycosyltransferase involved in cell wall biosynthesis
MISVVVTNYNYDKFLARCIRSLLNQTIPRSSYEVLVVDDASTDDSSRILSVFGNDITPIYLEKNSGLASSSNVGLRKAKGRYVVRVDSDDYVHPDFLKSILLYMELRGGETDAVALDYLKVDTEGKPLSICDGIKEPIACAIGFKFEVLEELGFYSEGMRIGEDLDLRNRFDKLQLRMGHLTLPLYRYTQHSESLTKQNLLR